MESVHPLHCYKLVKSNASKWSTVSIEIYGVKFFV